MPDPAPVIRRREAHDSLRFLYLLAIAAGITGAIYIYGFVFDDLSEEELILLSALWVLPTVFGAYGFVAEKLLSLMDEGNDLSIARAALIWTNALPVIGIFLLLPFLFVKGSNSISIAFFATLFWALLLLGFLAVIFPLL